MITRWRAAGAVAGVYGFFLIFAQFAFVELMRGKGIDAAEEKLALGAMALAGIVAGFLTARFGASARRLRHALVVCVVAGMVAPILPGLAVAMLTGAALGIATVSLAVLLPTWGGVVWVGLGTGVGYALCNLPWVFLAPPELQSRIGAALAMAALLLTPAGAVDPGKRIGGTLWPGLLGFLALVWLDSAAFFIIQHEREMKEGTWGAAMLWRNAGLHLGVAMIAGLWLARKGDRWILPVAWVFLAAAAVAVNHEGSRWLAGWLYPVGVSLYSTALVAWPGYSRERGPERGIGLRAAWLFALAGWFGSANGIGMAQALHHVPLGFVAVSGLAVALATVGLQQVRSVVAVAVVLLAAWWMSVEPGQSESVDPVERGKQVYLEEGCISCHTRYVRPNDPEGWGPPSNLAEVRKQVPVLIGNRRQGPDLAHVGARRSAAWLREHFIDPRKFAPDSPMPSYDHLFKDRRGEDLIDWLMADQGEALAWRIERANSWRPDRSKVSLADGGALFAVHCAVCHGAGGRGDGPLAMRFAKPPADLAQGPVVYAQGPDGIERVIRWGIPGTDMPGHETLSDAEVLALAEWVRGLR
ncbi:MAG: cbb3-type cytochrome c oxidase subunit II [Akkermansiaceae bacterium]|jgi:cytochrome c oxidase cbb3-type subunit 2|nr:cbb3-type cytochrome c oxidase subunit II [Akkermansiaceae bacterium]